MLTLARVPFPSSCNSVCTSHLAAFSQHSWIASVYSNIYQAPRVCPQNPWKTKGGAFRVLKQQSQPYSFLLPSPTCGFQHEDLQENHFMMASDPLLGWSFGWVIKTKELDVRYLCVQVPTPLSPHVTRAAVRTQ